MTAADSPRPPTSWPARSARAKHLVAGVAVILVTVLLSTCRSVTHVEAVPAALMDAGSSRFASIGPYAVEQARAEFLGTYGCTLEFETYRPVARSHGSIAGAAGLERSETMVFLAHGFMRDLTRMRGWGERFASHGVPTTVLSFCNSRFYAGRHDRNAEDLVALAAAVHAGPVVYAGFSAGGLAAYLATAADPRAVAYLGLDPVDSGQLAHDVRLDVPALMMFAEPSRCNAQGNFIDSIGEQSTTGGRSNRILEVPNATHCDFEDPYDPRCERLCGAVEPPAVAETIRSAIRAWATEWLVATVRPARELSSR